MRSADPHAQILLIFKRADLKTQPALNHFAAFHATPSEGFKGFWLFFILYIFIQQARPATGLEVLKPVDFPFDALNLFHHNSHDTFKGHIHPALLIS